MRRYRRYLLALVAMASIAIVAWRPFLTEVGSFLIVRDVPVAADAIVVLSGSLPDRILEAVDLYHAGYAPRIFLTREPLLPGFETLRARGVALPEHHEQNRAIATELGVPASAITVLEPRTSSTLAEAQAVVSELRAYRIGHILLVTSNAHARRARLIFESVARGDPRVTICPSRHDPFAAGTWWHHRGFVRRVIIEYEKLIAFLLLDRWRL